MENERKGNLKDCDSIFLIEEILRLKEKAVSAKLLADRFKTLYDDIYEKHIRLIKALKKIKEYSNKNQGYSGFHLNNIENIISEVEDVL